MIGVTVVGTLAVALTLLEGQLVDAKNASFTVLIPAPSEGYTPLVPALESVVRLAAEHVAEVGPLSQLGNVSLAVVESAEGAPAAASLCTAIGANNSETYTVSAQTPLRLGLQHKTDMSPFDVLLIPRYRIFTLLVELASHEGVQPIVST